MMQSSSTISVRPIIGSVVVVLLVVAAFAAVMNGRNVDEAQSPATTALFTAPTALLTAADCSNVMDWSFKNAVIVANNLGGVGPNFSDPEEIRYQGVANEVDMVVTIDKAYQKGTYSTNPKIKPNPVTGVMEAGNSNNGWSGKFGQVNIQGGTSVAMKFSLVETGTNNLIDIAPKEKVFFSVFDLDRGSPKDYEYVDFNTPVDSYSVTPTSTVIISGDTKSLEGKAGRFGTDSDNPTNPLEMTQVQKDSAIWVTYQGRNTWSMTFGYDRSNGKLKAGRNLMFAGRAEGDCKSTPLPPPGACEAKDPSMRDGIDGNGIEGVIKGGGRVCCPALCAGPDFGGPQRFAGAPYACGGPACDKGVDGARDPVRYMNCCVGKPVEGATTKDTITASYGIVSQGRFCYGALGSDAPPCINRLSKLSDRL